MYPDKYNTKYSNVPHSSQYKTTSPSKANISGHARVPSATIKGPVMTVEMARSPASKRMMNVMSPARAPTRDELKKQLAVLSTEEKKQLLAKLTGNS